MNIDEAMELAMRTDYAHDAVGEEINKADAGAFFLEGYMFAQKKMREAFIHGYEAGHNDTVESCYRCPEGKADDYGWGDRG